MIDAGWRRVQKLFDQPRRAERAVGTILVAGWILTASAAGHATADQGDSAPRIAVRSDDAGAFLVDESTGRRFEPRGFNYIRLRAGEFNQEASEVERGR